MPHNRQQKAVQRRKHDSGAKTHRGRSTPPQHIPQYTGRKTMPTLAELMVDRAAMDVLCDLGKIHVTYRPRVINPKWQREITKAEEDGAGDEVTLYQPLRDAVISWDLDESPGVPLEMTDEGLSTVPRQILNQVLWSLMTTARPNQKRPPELSTGGLLVPLTSTTTQES